MRVCLPGQTIQTPSTPTCPARSIARLSGVVVRLPRFGGWYSQRSWRRSALTCSAIRRWSARTSPPGRTGAGSRRASIPTADPTPRSGPHCGQSTFTALFRKWGTRAATMTRRGAHWAESVRPISTRSPSLRSCRYPGFRADRPPRFLRLRWAVWLDRSAAPGDAAGHERAYPAPRQPARATAAEDGAAPDGGEPTPDHPAPR